MRNLVSIFFSIIPILYNPNIDPIYTPIYYLSRIGEALECSLRSHETKHAAKQAKICFLLTATAATGKASTQLLRKANRYVGSCQLAIGFLAVVLGGFDLVLRCYYDPCPGEAVVMLKPIVAILELSFKPHESPEDPIVEVQSSRLTVPESLVSST